MKCADGRVVVLEVLVAQSRIATAPFDESREQTSPIRAPVLPVVPVIGPPTTRKHDQLPRRVPPHRLDRRAPRAARASTEPPHGRRDVPGRMVRRVDDDETVDRGRRSRIRSMRRWCRVVVRRRRRRRRRGRDLGQHDGDELGQSGIGGEDAGEGAEAEGRHGGGDAVARASHQGGIEEEVDRGVSHD